jgi:hypothetical protein
LQKVHKVDPSFKQNFVCYKLAEVLHSLNEA